MTSNIKLKLVKTYGVKGEGRVKKALVGRAFWYASNCYISKI